ncbi:hypothetical protein [Promicromonospora sukumoe]
MKLYHFTTAARAARIAQSGRLLRPHDMSDLGDALKSTTWGRELAGLIWMTDLDIPHREALGLTSHSIQVDRTEARFRVTGADAVSWMVYRRKASAELVQVLESAPGVMPMHWFVATQPITVVHDPIGVAA